MQCYARAVIETKQEPRTAIYEWTTLEHRLDRPAAVAALLLLGDKRT